MDIFTAANDMEIFLCGVIVGVFLGLVYDLMRALRFLFPHGKALTFLEDFFYVIFFAFALFVFSTALVGKIRYFTLLSMLLGGGFERLLLGRFIVRAAQKISGFFRKKVIDKCVGFITKICGKIKSHFVKTA